MTDHDPTRPEEPTPDGDALTGQYREAVRLADTARPGVEVRAAVLAEAALQASARSAAAVAAPLPPGPPAQPAANDSRWRWRAVAGLMVFGFAGLLALQVQQTPQDAEGDKAAVPADVVAQAPAPQARAPQAPAADVTSELPGALRESLPAAPPAAGPAPPTPEPASGLARERYALERQAPPPAAAPGAGHQAPGAAAAPAGPSEEAAVADALSRSRPAPLGLTRPQDTSQPPPAAAPAPLAAAPEAESRDDPARNLARAYRQAQAAQRVAPASLPRQPAADLVALAEAGDTTALRERLARGTDPDSRDARGRTALAAAAEAGQSDAVALLLQARADPRLPDARGRTPLELARQHADPRAARLIEAALAR
ncbi:ankyrin repeat domain-containing protein [Aquabacterium sp. A7-Y]|uniref:ankyrin repeat domain-containing protein n=1 Tax=Aquabacterium sp. A7-Y TaxID=1349605 RepID=UPI00223E83F2|nr:ankyrin repeat domain-containing protein [Aquabacterium sp. A7-Y]MCW7537659.1 ankyrin repeat domain-containing protein [Aquabacterium sp. A7-Y]